MTPSPAKTQHRGLLRRLWTSFRRCFSRIPFRSSTDMPYTESASASRCDLPIPPPPPDTDIGAEDISHPQCLPPPSVVVSRPSTPSSSASTRGRPRLRDQIRSFTSRRSSGSTFRSIRGPTPTTSRPPSPDASGTQRPSATSMSTGDPGALVASSLDASPLPSMSAASELAAPSLQVSEQHVDTPMIKLYKKAVAEWERKAKDLASSDVGQLDSKKDMFDYIARSKAEVLQGDQLRKLEDRLVPLARVLEKLCTVVGDTVSLVFSPSKVIFTSLGLLLNASLKTREEFEQIVDAFDEVRMHLQVVEIVVARPEGLLYDTSVELLVQIITVLGEVIEMRHQRYVGRFLSAIADIHPLRDSMQGMKRVASRLHEAIIARTLEVVGNMQVAGEMKDIMVWLNYDYMDLSQRMSSLLNDRADGTGLWFLNDETFVHFMEGRIKVLSIQGKAGCGKSTIIAAANRHLQAYCASRGPEYLVATHFFNLASSSERGDLDSVLSSFLCQLALRDQRCMDILVKAHQQSIMSGCFTRDEKLDTLVTMLGIRLRIFLVIDALDEARESERPKILDALRKLRSHNDISILVSTRSGEHEGLQHAVVSIDQVQDNTDVRIALDIAIGDPERLAGIANAKMVRNKLLDRAEGNMRWLTLAVEELRSAVNDPRKLDLLLDKLPRSLEELYSNRLDAIRADDIGDTKLLLAWILHCTHLTTTQLSRVLAFNYSARMPRYEPTWLSPKPDAQISGLMDSMFFSIDDGAVRIAHASVREFLVALPPSSPFHTSGNDAICLIARTSLAYLLAVSKGIASAYHDRDLWKLWHHLIFVGGPDCYAALEQDIEGVLSRVRASSPPAHILSYALATAIKSGHEGLLSMLLENGASVLDRAYGYTPLELAAFCGQVEIVRLLLDKGAQVEDRNEDGWTALHFAARWGHLGMVSMLLEHGASVDARNKKQDTPLTIAANNSREEIVRLLLDKGAQVEDRNETGLTALHHAAEKGHLGITSLLLEYGASVAARNKKQDTPLTIAANNNREDIVRLLLDKGAQFEDRDGTGRTALHFAARRGHLGIASMLLEHGASVDTQTEQQSTPLTIAANNSREDIVRLLLDKGAHIEHRDEDGDTSLHGAAWSGCLIIVRTLSERGADVNVINNIHHTPLHNAAQKGHAEIAQLLVDRGAVLEARDTDGWTPLYLAVWCCQESVIALLLSLGSDLRTRADDGTTLLDAVGRDSSWRKDAERDTRVRELLMRAGCTEKTGRIPLVNGVLPESARAASS